MLSGKKENSNSSSSINTVISDGYETRNGSNSGSDDDEMNDCLNSSVFFPEGPPNPLGTPVGHNLVDLSSSICSEMAGIQGVDQPDRVGNEDDGTCIPRLSPHEIRTIRAKGQSRRQECH